MDVGSELLEKYKRVPFAEGLLPFRASIGALGTLFAVINAKQDGRRRWVICEKSTGNPALFSHAAVYAQGDDPETGNYIPGNEEILAGVEVRNVQRRANSKCFYMHILDTYTDLSLFECQWALDEYMVGVPGFNPAGLPRRSYLSGKDPNYQSRFWMQSPMFLWKGADSEQSGAVDHLHPWVVQGDRESKVFRANPDRPRLWMRDGDETVPIVNRELGPLQRGDVVALSFTVTYHISRSNWFPQFHPADIVVLWCSDGDPTDYSGPTINLYNRPPPSFVTVDAEGGGIGRSRSEDTELPAAKRPRIDHEDAVGEGEGEKVGESEGRAESGSMEVGRRSCDTLDSTGEGGKPMGEDREGFAAVEGNKESAYGGMGVEAAGKEAEESVRPLGSKSGPPEEVDTSSVETLGSIEGIVRESAVGKERAVAKGEERKSVEDAFVDVVAEEEGRQAVHVTTGKSGRAVRKRA